MERTSLNIIDSFFYYMWNKWSEQECEIIFPKSISQHLWGKWLGYCEFNVSGAVEKFYADLDSENKQLLIDRALQLYDGRSRRNITLKIKKA